MKQVKSLVTYNSVKEALSKIEELSAKFLATFKRKESVELTITVMSSPFDRSKKRIADGFVNETAEVRCWYEDQNSQQVEEMNWFINQI